MEKLHPKAVWLFFTRSLGVLIPVLFFFGFSLISVFVDSEKEVDLPTANLLPIILSALVLYVVICYIWARLSYKYWRYEVSDDALKIEKGVIWKKYISIPYERVQNVDIYRGLLARMLGLSDLNVQTAGYSAGPGRGGGFRSEGRLLGLSPQRAEELREELVKRARGAKQGL